MSKRLVGSLVSAGISLYIAIQLHHVQFATPHLVDRDSYYHTRYANLMPERGLSRGFPWTQYSFWKTRFADKEFLFHAWLAPFCRKEAKLVSGGKFAAWLLAGGVLAAFGIALRVTGARAPILWVFVLFSAGNHFLFRMMEVRAHVLSVILFIAGVALLLKGRYRWLLLVGFVYSWSYAAPHLLVGIAIVHALAVAIHEKKFEWRGLAFAAGGVAAGLVIHPYFPNNLHLWWVQNVVVLGQAWGLGGDLGLRLGEEFAPILPRSLIESSTAVFLGFLGGVVLSIVAARAGKLSLRTFTLLFVALACFTLYCLSARFIEYFAPAAVWFFASAVSDLYDEAWLKSKRAWAWGGVLASILVLLHVRTMDRTLSAVRTYPGPSLRGAARWTRANVPPGHTVLHLNWGDFVQLFHYDPTHVYINGLDPSFMLVNDPERVRYLEDVRTGKRPVNGSELSGIFGAEVLIVSKELPRQVWACDQARLLILYKDDGAVVYQLSP